MPKLHSSSYYIKPYSVTGHLHARHLTSSHLSARAAPFTWVQDSLHITAQEASHAIEDHACFHVSCFPCPGKRVFLRGYKRRKRKSLRGWLRENSKKGEKKQEFFWEKVGNFFKEEKGEAAVLVLVYCRDFKKEGKDGFFFGLVLSAIRKETRKEKKELLCPWCLAVSRGKEKSSLSWLAIRW